MIKHGKAVSGRLLDAVCVAGVFLMPVVLGIFFIVLLLLKGAPAWYLVIHGILFAASLAALIWFISIGLFRAIRGKNRRKRKDGDSR